MYVFHFFSVFRLELGLGFLFHYCVPLDDMIFRLTTSLLQSAAMSKFVLRFPRMGNKLSKDVSEANTTNIKQSTKSI